MKKEAFIYTWSTEDEDTVSKKAFHIRMYGMDQDNRNVCIHADDFMPYFYIEIGGIPENEVILNKNAIIRNIIYLLNADHLQEECEEGGCRNCWNGKMTLVSGLKKLYFHHTHNSFSLIKMEFVNNMMRKKTYYKLQEKKIQVGMRVKKAPLWIHENEANPILQFCTERHIDTAGWVRWKKDKDNKTIINPGQTRCDHEFRKKYTLISPLEDKDKPSPLPYVLSFDIEVYSSVPTRMPDAEKKEDVVFQISMVFTRDQKHFKNYLLSLGKPIQSVVGKNVIVKVYPCEKELLLGFTKVLQAENPNVVIGYNIFGFDMMYMIARAKLWGIMDKFDQMGARTKDGLGREVHSPEKTINWSSSAYSHQNFMFLDTEGRLFVDLLPVVRRDFKFENYRLKTISEYFIGETKDPIKPKDIFEGYRLSTLEGQPNRYNLLSRVGKYCVQDSRLVLLLFEKLQMWIGLTEMAKTCRVPVLTLYTQGQQIKVFSQLYYLCTHEKIVVQSPHSLGTGTKYIEGADHYSGAYVFPPVPGVYDWVIPFDFCLAGETLVSLPNGTSKRIDSLTNDTMVLGYKDGGFRNFSSINGLQVKGMRDTVKVILQDGQTLIATPDHKIMMDNGEWCQAKDLKGKKVKCGVEGTEDTICPLEKEWYLDVEEYTFTMDDNGAEREKSLAFARMLGYILADGSIYMSSHKDKDWAPRRCVEACFGTMIDATAFKMDMMKLSGVDVKIRKRVRPNTMKGTTFTIALPSVLAKMIHSLEDIVVGKRCTQEMKLPAFILDPKCPLSIVREFLGGLYGGDGVAPCIRHVNIFGNIRFKWTSIKKYVNNMIEVFKQLQNLHLRLGIDVNINDPYKIEYKTEKNIKPKDYDDDNCRYDIQLSVSVHNAFDFLQRIGFRYCINKSCKLSIVSSYQRMYRKTEEQYKGLCIRAIELKKNGLSYQEGLDKAIEEFVGMPIQNCVFPSVKNIKDYQSPKSEKIKRKRFHDFPKTKDYIEQLGVEKWFDGYAVGQDDELVPSYSQTVIDVVEHEPMEVFDIEVDDAHNFIAASILSSNCSLYPSAIIAYNIDFSTMVTDDSVPDDQCHVIQWWDHIGCDHDTTVHATKPKHIVCQEFRFRFLKEKVGVIPRLLNDLLSARSSTKKQMKEVDKKIKNGNISEEEKRSLETLYKVYDKRQLAYKVSANSMYGAMGVKKGYLPFLPGAMCTTAMGRYSIQKAAAHVKKHYNGRIVYGDTDSIYCHFPLPTQPEYAVKLWEYAKQVETELLDLFPKPMKLAFEEKIYKKFMILTKKRYMALTCDHQGKDDTKLTIRGVLLARRDNARWVRNIYEKVVRSIMANISYKELIEHINNEVLGLFRSDASLSFKQFIVSKTLGKDYAIRDLPTEESKRKKRLADLSIDPTRTGWMEEYTLRSQPAHAQLAERMKNRGSVVEPGSRIEYVLVQHPETNPKLFERIEDPSYVMEHSDLIKIDPVYYAQNLINPVDQALEVCFKRKKVVEKMIDHHIRFKMLMMELVWHFHPYEFHDTDGTVSSHPSMLKFIRHQKKILAKKEKMLKKQQQKSTTATDKKKKTTTTKKSRVSIVEIMKDILKK
jgi:DNA polymerase elongation subunit (family B)